MILHVITLLIFSITILPTESVAMQEAYPIEAKIRFCPMFGRQISFFKEDNNKNLAQLTFKFYDGGTGGSIEYNGPLDIKNAQHTFKDDYTTIKVSQIKNVKEYDSYASAFFVRGMAFFFPRIPTYLKQEIIYQDNGSITKKVSFQHRGVQLTQAMIAAGGLYLAYSCFIKN
ncbi:MAG: hypothetical protein WC707_04765 [Candidatus Babeliaceae bacterium]|jgi:hypothetical protein